MRLSSLSGRRMSTVANRHPYNKNGDIFVGDPVEKSSEDQVLLEEAILDLYWE